MAFPPSPTDTQQHTEGFITYEYNAAFGTWLEIDQAGSGATNIGWTPSPTGATVTSSTGTDGTATLVDGTNAGLMTPADKSKLDGITAGATPDQDATGVVYVNTTSNLTATDLQAAVDELDGRVDTLGSVTGNFVGQFATSAGLDASTDPITGAAPDDGDIAYLNADEGGREAGFYIRTGGSWPATPFFQVPDSFVAADATTSDNLSGDGGSANTYARSDHRHAQSRGATLPANDGSAGIEHVLANHASLPDGKYVLIGTAWVQV